MIREAQKLKEKVVRSNLTNELNKNAEKYQKAHHRKSIWYRVLSILSAITVFITTYALILPAITKEPSPGVKMDNSFLYETEEVIMNFKVTGRAVFENEDIIIENLSSDKVTLSVTPLSDESMVYEQYKKYADENIGSDDLYKLLAVRLAFTYEGEKLDMANCEITADITSKNGLFQIGNGNLVSGDIMIGEDSINLPLGGTSLNPITGAKQQEVLAFSSIQGIAVDIAEQDTAYLAEGEETLSLFTTLASTSDTMAFALYSTINPKYTVQYYSHVTVFDDDGDVSIDVIDTSGGVLPRNGKDPKTMKAYLNYDKTVGAYVMAMHLELNPLYSSKEYEYISAPGVAYIDRNRENGNFVLSEIWVLKDGKSPTSTKASDFNVYPPTVSFTNREASASTNRIFIEDGTVIRLIYNEIDGGYTSGANFYDYDITDGNIYNTSGTKYSTSSQNKNTWLAQTQYQGINNSKNYTGSGTKLAFGNVNTGTGYGTVQWTDPNGVVTTPNQYNRVNGVTKGFMGCTFGLVTGMNDDQTLVYAKGITAPVLFGYDEAVGKTMIHGYTLQFNRTGDTYVLSSINGTGTNNLQYFTNPTYKDADGDTVLHDHIFTNNFWPMDYSPTYGANGHDMKFGDAVLYGKRKYFATTSSFSSQGNFPPSDDGIDHNSYFGMNYEVEFTLTEDYLGHLEYIFYGDDDMWVFLDGQLVCDIGGVHSSVGQYVNLWDYINKMPNEQKYGKHTLSFYYTERGASGSTCYMQFTLPSVSIDTPQIESNTLELGKTVENSDTNMSFEFIIELFDENGLPLVDDYSYTLHDKDGTALGTAIINSDEKIVYLKHGQYIEINYLPQGVRYRITESVYSSFHTSYIINSDDYIEGYTAEGDLTGNTRVQFINSTSVVLPATGGFSMWVFAIPFVLAIIYGLSIPLIERYSKKRKMNKSV